MNRTIAIASLFKDASNQNVETRQDGATQRTDNRTHSYSSRNNYCGGYYPPPPPQPYYGGGYYYDDDCRYVIPCGTV